MKNALILSLLMMILNCATQAQTARQLYLGYENSDKITPAPKVNGKIQPVRIAKKGKPGAKVIIELSRDGKTSFVSPNSLFRSGDKIRLRFETNFDGYLAILNVGSTGALNLLFPYEGADAQIKPSKNTIIPKGDDWIVFDENRGTEILTIVMAKTQIALQNEAELRELNKKAANKRDLFIESDDEATYAVCTTATLSKPVGFTLRLKHGN